MMRWTVAWALAGLVACAAVVSPESQPAPDGVAEARLFRERYAALKVAARGDDVAAFRRAADAAFAVAPEVPNVIAMRAMAQALSGDRDAAFDSVAAFAATGMSNDLAAMPAFATLRDDARFAALSARLAENAAARGVVELAFTAQGVPTDFVPESIVRDDAHDRWLLGSVRHARIDAVDARGAAYDFVPERTGGLLSALGMRLIGDTLWVATAGFAETAGVSHADIGRSGILDIDAAHGTVRSAWWLPTDDGAHALGDVLVVGSDVYASDSIGGGIYRLDAAREALRPLLAPGVLSSPQGMAWHHDAIIVADYPSGLWRFDPASAALGKLRVTVPAGLTGIDGLYADNGDLIAIQNGTTPKRILRIRFDEAGVVSRVDVLAQNLIGWGEPSLATIHDGALYYIANSQWDRFDANGQLPPPEQLEAPRIMRLPLN